VSLFLAHIYYGHWIRSFQIQISTGKWFIWVVTSWTIATTSSQVITELYPERFGRLLLILLIGDEVTYYQVDVISTGCYTTMSILFYGTLILNLLPTSYVTRTDSLSDVAISNVCKYSGIRLLQSTYLILLVLLVHLLFFL